MASKPSTKVAADWCVVYAEPGQAALDWALLDRAGECMASGHGDPPQQSDASASQVIGLCDAGDCTPLILDLPVLSKQQEAQAMRWAAEEFVAGPIELEHVVKGKREQGGALRAVTITEAKMDSLMTALAGWKPDAVMPDALCLPHQPGQLSLGRRGDRILMRWDEWAFAAYPEKVALGMLDSLASMEWVWWGDAQPPQALQGRVRWMESDTGLMVVLARQATSLPVNLLTGRFEPASANQTRAQWMKVGALLVACLVLLVGYAGIEQYLLVREAKALRAEVGQVYQSLFPDQPAMGRERELAERALARLQLGQSAGLLDLMSRVGPILAGQSVELESLSFQEGQLRLDLKADDVASLDEVGRLLNRAELRASVRSATLSADGARGQIEIEQAIQ